MELINGRTAEEIECAMEYCTRRKGRMKCNPFCTYFSVANCWLEVMRDAMKLIAMLKAAQPRWISGSCPPRERGEVLVIARGKPKENIQLLDAYELAEYVPGEGWIFEAYPEWEGGEVRWWMPLPEEPEEGA